MQWVTFEAFRMLENAAKPKMLKIAMMAMQTNNSKIVNA